MLVLRKPLHSNSTMKFCRRRRARKISIRTIAQDVMRSWKRVKLWLLWIGSGTSGALGKHELKFPPLMSKLLAVLDVWCAEPFWAVNIWVKTVSRTVKRITKSPSASSAPTVNATSAEKSSKLEIIITFTRHARDAPSAAIRSVTAKKCIFKAQQFGIRVVDQVRLKMALCWSTVAELMVKSIE